MVRLLFRLDLSLSILHSISYVIFHFLVPKTVAVSAGDGTSAQFSFNWLPHLFDLNEEANIPTWYSSMQLFLVGLLLAVFAHARFDRKKLAASLGLSALASLFVLLSLDEVAQLHENLGGKLVHVLRSGHHSYGISLLAFWAALVVPFVTVSYLIGRCAWEHLKERKAFVVRFVISMAVYLGFAVGCELVWVAIFGGDPSDSFLEVVIEETGEMIGVTLLVWTVWDLLSLEKISFAFKSPQSAE